MGNKIRWDLRMGFLIISLMLICGGLQGLGSASGTSSNANEHAIANNEQKESKSDVPLPALNAWLKTPEDGWEPIYRCTENITKQYAANQTTEPQLFLATPDNFDRATYNFSMEIQNEVLNEIGVVPSENDEYSRFEQAQSFIIENDQTLLTKLALFGGSNKKQNPEISIQLRNNSYLGEVLVDITHTLVEGWNDISLEQAIELNAGKYFIWVDFVSSPAFKSWCRTPEGVNSTETWIYDGGSWVQPEYDLSLKIYTQELLDISAMGIEVCNTPVEIVGAASASVTIARPTITALETFSITKPEDISIIYTISANYCREYNATLLQKTVADSITYDIYLNTSYSPESEGYCDYSLSIFGIMDDYDELLIFLDKTPVAYQNELESSNTIFITEKCNRMRLIAPNYVENLALPEMLFTDDTIQISTEGGNEGVIELKIYSEQSLVYENATATTNSSGLIDFSWKIPASLPSTKLNVTLTYYGENQFGYREQMIDYNHKGELSSNLVEIQTLQQLKLQCGFFDLFTQDPIEDGEVSFQIGDLSGILHHESDGIYSKVLDLETFALKPGIYSIIYSGLSEGFETNSAQQALSIGYRNAYLDVTQSKTTVKPGDQIDLEISVKDPQINSKLLRTVDLKCDLVPIVPEGGPNPTPVLTHWAYEVNQNEQFSWNIPSDLAPGEYQIQVSLNSEYYKGEIIIENALQVESPGLWWGIPVGISVFGVSIAAQVGVRNQKRRVRKSLKGVLILHEQGLPLAQVLSEDLSVNDPQLIAGAITGTMAIIKQITGESIHTIGIKGGYLNMVKSQNIWLVSFLEKNPSWIKKTLHNLLSDILSEHGEYLENFSGRVKDISLIELVKKNFGVRSQLFRTPKCTEQIEEIIDDPAPRDDYMSPSDNLDTYDEDSDACAA